MKKEYNPRATRYVLLSLLNNVEAYGFVVRESQNAAWESPFFSCLSDPDFLTRI